MTATKKQLAFWSGLKNRRDREDSGLFLAEGRKLVAEVRRAGWQIEALLAAAGSAEAEQGYALSPENLSWVSGFRSSPEVVAVVRRPLSLSAVRWVPGSLALVLDGLQDPGNVGTLLRTAAWFGFDAVFHSPDTADPFGPKAVQASMGAIVRVRTGLTDEAWWSDLPASAPVAAASLQGENLFSAALPAEGLVVLGNEGHGLSPRWEARAGLHLTVPAWGSAAESLNVAAAGALVMAEFRRRMPQ